MTLIIKLLHIKINQILVFIFLLMIVFVSCKKTADREKSEYLSQDQIKIQNWFASQKTNNAVKRNLWIDSLTQNLLYDQMWTEKKKGVQYTIVPINDNFKFKNNKGQRVSNYFVRAINANSKKYIYSLIVQYKPTNQQNSTDITEGTIASIFNNEPIDTDCNVRYITIFDNFLYSKIYKNNEYVSTSNLNIRINNNQKINENSNNIKSNSTNGEYSTKGCIDWYWVTTYSDYSQTFEFAFTTCPGAGCYDTELYSICHDGEGVVGGGGSTPQTIPTDPCADAQMGSTHATNLSQKSNFTSAKTNIIAAAAFDKKEHGVTFGRDASGNITVSNITNGSENWGTVPNLTGAFADLHNHPNLGPPSSGDLYGFIDKSVKNSSFETRYILTNNGPVYALTVTNIEQAINFNSTHPRVPPPAGTNFEPNFPDEILNEINEMRQSYGVTDEMAMAFVMEKYKMGVALLKQDSNGDFKRLNTIENTTIDGTRKFYKSNNCQ